MSWRSSLTRSLFYALGHWEQTYDSSFLVSLSLSVVHGRNKQQRTTLWRTPLFSMLAMLGYKAVSVPSSLSFAPDTQSYPHIISNYKLNMANKPAERSRDAVPADDEWTLILMSQNDDDHTADHFDEAVNTLLPATPYVDVIRDPEVHARMAEKLLTKYGYATHVSIDHARIFVYAITTNNGPAAEHPKAHTSRGNSILELKDLATTCEIYLKEHGYDTDMHYDDHRLFLYAVARYSGQILQCDVDIVPYTVPDLAPAPDQNNHNNGDEHDQNSGNEHHHNKGKK
jgi:hypothetical protein